LPNFVLSRTYVVPETGRSQEETMELRDRRMINLIYDKWWADSSTVRIQLIERKMDSVEVIRQDSRR
jgi:hypothetical protein